MPWQEIEARWLTGELSRNDIAREYGIARTTVLAHFRREKLEQRRAEYNEALRREVVERTAGPIAERVLDQAIDLLNDLRALRRAAIGGLLEQIGDRDGTPPIAEQESKRRDMAIAGTGGPVSTKDAGEGVTRTKRIAYRLDSRLVTRALQVEADLLLRLGKGIRLLEPESRDDDGADNPRAFVQQVIDAGRAIDASTTPQETLPAPPDRAADEQNPDGTE